MFPLHDMHPYGSRALLILVCMASPLGATPTIQPTPDPAMRRIATVEVRVAPEHPDWTYKIGETVRFRVSITADKTPLAGIPFKYTVGLEGMPAETRDGTSATEAVWIDGGRLDEPGFIRCVVTAGVDGRVWRGVAAAGIEPGAIQATQTDPGDFDAFWNDGKARLAAIPLEPVLTLLPDACTDKVNVYHVGVRAIGEAWTAPARVYGILCEPKEPGKYPAVLRVPGAGARPYFGDKELAARGAITFEIGIHGIPVNQPKVVYDQLLAGALNGYWFFNYDNRETCYYHRVILSCLRANDFLVSRGNWDGKNLVVTGASQGGALSIATAALDPRVTGLAAIHPALCDLTGDLRGRAGGWPRPFERPVNGEAAHATPAKIATSAYYDTVNFARRLDVPGFYTWGYSDEVCAPTSMFAAFNAITAPKQLALQLEVGHAYPQTQHEAIVAWIADRLGL